MSKQNTYFVKLNSQDKQVVIVNRKIIKLAILQRWLDQSLSLLKRFLKGLNELEKIDEKTDMGKKIEEIEAYFFTSVMLFVRCFTSQKGTHLKIKGVTSDQKLLSCFKHIKSLRNDEFVHWQGLQINPEISYSARPEGEEFVFAESFHVKYQFRIGPSGKSEQFEELIKTTINHVVEQRTKTILRLSQLLQNSAKLGKTKFTRCE